MSLSTFSRANINIGRTDSVFANLRSRVKDVADLDKRIRAFNPSYQGSSLFGKHASYFSDPNNFADEVDDMSTTEGQTNNDGTAWQITRLLNAYSQSVDKTTEFVEKLADKIQIAGVPLSAILDLMGYGLSSSSPAQNQFEPYFVALMNAINEVHAATVQLDFHKLMEDIQTTMANAKSAAQGATQWLSLGKPSFDTHFVVHDSASRNAVNEMMGEGRWRKLFDISDYTHWETGDFIPWSTFLAAHNAAVPWQKADLSTLTYYIPKESGGLVYTYQLALPALLYTINARLTVLRTFFPDFMNIKQTYKDEIHGWIEFLHKQLSKIEQAIWVEDPYDWELNSNWMMNSHYCCNLFTGEFVCGDPKKDEQFIQQYHKNTSAKAVKDFIAQRYLSMYVPLVSGLKKTIANLYTIAGLTPYAWRDLGIEIKGNAGVAVVPKLSLCGVFVKGSDDKLWSANFSATSITLWSLIDDTGQILSSPAAVSDFPGRFDLFAAIEGGVVIHKSFRNSKWNDWEFFGGKIKGNVGAVSPAEGVIDLYVRGMDDALWQKYLANGVWTDWFPLDNSMKLASSPVAISNDAGHRAIYMHTEDGTVYHKYWNGQWHPWENLGKPPVESKGILKIKYEDVTAVSDKNGVTDIYVRAVDLTLWRKTYNNGWSNWGKADTSDNFQFQSAPTAICFNKMQRGVFVRGWDNKLYYKHWDD